MADVRNPNHQRPTRLTGPPFSNNNSFLRKLQAHAPNSSQLLGILTLFISGSILLLLIGLTVTATILGLIFFAPWLILFSPIWVATGTIFFIIVGGFLSLCGFAVAVLAGMSWMYRFFRGMHPPGLNRNDYARIRIHDTASHVKDYAREYGGYLQSKVKDAAPGA